LTAPHSLQTSLTALLGDPKEGLARLEEPLQKAREAEAKFVSDQFEIGREARNQTEIDVRELHEAALAELKQFHSDSEAA
jgi:hypothetical protein